MSLSHLARKVETCHAAGDCLGSQRTEHVGYSCTGAHTLPVGGDPHCVLGTTLGPVAHRDREREVSQLGILQKLT